MGEIDVLNVGLGHLKIEVSESDEASIEKARQVVTDMLQRGYSVFVEGEDGKLSRVKKFHADKMVYIIDDPKTKKATKQVSATKAKATAIGRSAGG